MRRLPFDLRTPDGVDGFAAFVAAINATPVPVAVPLADGDHRAARTNPILTHAGHRAMFLAGPVQPHCCAYRKHQPHKWGLYQQYDCDGTPAPRRLELVQ